MKANDQESQLFSDAIDAINNGMEDIINLYNALEEEQQLIQFEESVVAHIEKAKAKYGEAFVDQKINTVIKEMLDWLPLDDGEKNEKAET
ncbi:hypothetical protein GCM10011391_24340 [Pullulanibacillus camelliae]|uniref:Atypical membrane-integrating protein (Mistic protein) n=1 Tax=Pullulanibacillus camelliae TaxID=1707096 RepID=A0A8J2YIB8_9BACL|nr:atypical membrane-integrating protein (Mistic protein) [Pullulanibacillus camelliae]GGE44647.1 hypothetical protein GCM10011391_24340 [Pullulanibacillus camelliae]